MDTDSDSDSLNSSNSNSSIDLYTPHASRRDITELLDGMRPKNLNHYLRAFVHKSISRNIKNAPKGSKVLKYMLQSNETLEFLGDSVLGKIVSVYLFHKFPDKAEGFLTRTKTKIVRREGCAMFARHLGLHKYILTSDHIRINKSSDKILEDTFEAFVGAIYLGFSTVVTVVVMGVEKFGERTTVGAL